MSKYNLVAYQGYPNANKYRAFDVKEMPGVVVVQVHGTWRVYDEIPLDADAGHHNWTKLVLDLSNTSYMDSSALLAILNTHSSVLQKDGAVKLSGLTKRISDLLATTKLRTILEVYDSLDDAIRSYEMPVAFHPADGAIR